MESKENKDHHKDDKSQAKPKTKPPGPASRKQGMDRRLKVKD